MNNLRDKPILADGLRARRYHKLVIVWFLYSLKRLHRYRSEKRCLLKVIHRRHLVISDHGKFPCNPSIFTSHPFQSLPKWDVTTPTMNEAIDSSRWTSFGYPWYQSSFLDDQLVAAELTETGSRKIQQFISCCNLYLSVSKRRFTNSAVNPFHSLDISLYVKGIVKYSNRIEKYDCLFSCERWFANS